MRVGPNSPLSNIALESVIIILFSACKIALCVSIIYIYRLAMMLLLDNFAFVATLLFLSNHFQNLKYDLHLYLCD